MATQDYYTIKNAALITPTTATDLGSVSQPYGNLYLQGNVTLGSTTLTSTNAITPKISTITYPGTETATDTAGGETITLTGSGFTNGCSILVGSTTASVVGFVSSNVVTFTAPVMAAGSYTLYVINPDGGTAISIPGINYSGTPTWSTASGSLGSGYEGSSISATFAATGDAPITYVLSSGTLPAGSTLSSSGSLSGTASTVSVSTTYNFTIAAKDAQNQPTNRNFSLTINPDTVSWVSPADNTTTNLASSELMANITMSATSAASGTIAYTANALPTGLTITGANIAGTPTGSGSSSSLITATSSPSGKTATRTFNWVVTVANDTYWKYTTMLLNAEGAAASDNAVNNTFLDSSTNNFSITKEGYIGQGTFSPYSASSWSNYFTNSSITVPNNTSLNMGAGAYTIEGWFNTDTLAGQQTIIGFQEGLKITVVSSGIRVWGDVAGGIYETATATIKTNTWYHVAWVRESTSLGKLYLDGTLILTVTSSSIVSYMPAVNEVTIGWMGDAYTNYFVGYISNLRILKGTALYTSAFTPTTSSLTAISGTSLLTCQNNRFIDNSPNNSTLTITNTVIVHKFSPFNGTAVYTPATHGGSASFNGSDNAIVVSAGATGALAFGTGDYTIECWVYATTVSDARAVFVINTGSGYSFILRYGGTIYWQLYYPGGDKTDLTMNSNNNGANQWTHHAIVRNSSVLKWYINGVQVYSVANTSSSSDTQIRLGNYSSYWWKGYISSLRIVKGTAVYTSAFTPPTAPVTAISNTSLLLNFTNAGIIDQTGINDIINMGDTSAKISTSVKKFGNGSFSFGGTGGWLEPRQPNPILRLGKGDWTFEFWLRLPNITQSAIWLINWNTDPRLNLDNATLSWMTAGTARITTGNVLTANTWQHIAVVRYNGSTKIYVDGTQSGSAYTDSTSYTVTDMDAIGYHPFTGYIDDFRITKGYARYTSNFTAPTSTFVTR